MRTVHQRLPTFGVLQSTGTELMEWDNGPGGPGRFTEKGIAMILRCPACRLAQVASVGPSMCIWAKDPGHKKTLILLNVDRPTEHRSWLSSDYPPQKKQYEKTLFSVPL